MKLSLDERLIQAEERRQVRRIGTVGSCAMFVLPSCCPDRVGVPQRGGQGCLARLLVAPGIRGYPIPVLGAHDALACSLACSLARLLTHSLAHSRASSIPITVVVPRVDSSESVDFNQAEGACRPVSGAAVSRRPRKAGIGRCEAGGGVGAEEGARAGACGGGWAALSDGDRAGGGDESERTDGGGGASGAVR